MNKTEQLNSVFITPRIISVYTFILLLYSMVKRQRGKELATLPHHVVALCMRFSTRHIPYTIYSMGLPNLYLLLHVYRIQLLP